MIDLSRAEILFFDLGNVFVSDDPSAAYAYEALYRELAAQGRFSSPEEFFEARTQDARNGGSLWSFVKQFIPGEDFPAFQSRVRNEMYCQWPALSPEVPGMREAAEKLATKYRMGIIANQPTEVSALLEERQLRSLFDVVVISADVKMEKPHEGIFLHALELAGLPAESAVMIGDRIDNDIVPAKKLGMQTVWVRLGDAGRGYVPTDEFRQHFARSLAQVNRSEIEPAGSHEEPEAVVRSAEELVRLFLG